MWATHAQSVDDLDYKNGLELLCSAANYNLATHPPKDLDFASEIVKLFGGFPLALSNAAAYIGSKQIDFKNYYERITRNTSQKFIDTVGDISIRVGLEYKNSKTVFTWILSHNELSFHSNF